MAERADALAHFGACAPDLTAPSGAISRKALGAKESEAARAERRNGMRSDAPAIVEDFRKYGELR